MASPHPWSKYLIDQAESLESRIASDPMAQTLAGLCERFLPETMATVKAARARLPEIVEELPKIAGENLLSELRALDRQLVRAIRMRRAAARSRRLLGADVAAARARAVGQLAHAAQARELGRDVRPFRLGLGCGGSFGGWGGRGFRFGHIDRLVMVAPPGFIAKPPNPATPCAASSAAGVSASELHTAAAPVLTE